MKKGKAGGAYYRKADRRAVIALLVVCIAGVVGLYLSGGDSGGTGADSADSAAAVRPARPGAAHRKSGAGGYYYAGEHRAELFPFDPNTADSTALLRLGLQPWQVRSIYKYRAKGGVYRRAADFARLYGLTAGQYRRLEPYIRIAPEFRPASLLPEARHVAAERDTLRYPVKIWEGEQIALNTADTAQLKRVPGIGSGRARAIVAYGKRLGGYVSVSQLDEIEGIPGDAKRFFVISGPQTVRLNVNKLTVAQLSRHPYITFHQARAIVDYRRTHGPISSLHDLSLHRDFTPEAIARLEPYVEF